MNKFVLLLISIFLFGKLVFAGQNLSKIDYIKSAAKGLLHEHHVLFKEGNIDNLSIYFSNEKLINQLSSDDNIAEIKLENVNKTNNSFKLQIKYVKEGVDNQIKLIGHYKEFVLIPMLKSRMRSGYIIEDKDLAMVKIDVKKLNHDIIREKEYIIGKTPRNTLNAYIPIIKTNMKAPITINKNELVTVLYNKGGVKLKMSGVTIDSGSIGGTIRVKNPKSKIILHAIIGHDKILRVN